MPKEEEKAYCVLSSTCRVGLWSAQRCRMGCWSVLGEKKRGNGSEYGRIGPFTVESEATNRTFSKCSYTRTGQRSHKPLTNGPRLHSELYTTVYFSFLGALSRSLTRVGHVARPPFAESGTLLLPTRSRLTSEIVVVERTPS